MSEIPEAFEIWFARNMANADGGFDHLPEWLKDDMARAWIAGGYAEADSRDCLAGISRMEVGPIPMRSLTITFSSEDKAWAFHAKVAALFATENRIATGNHPDAGQKDAKNPRAISHTKSPNPSSIEEEESAA